jgi:hypothetical protein
LLVSALSNKTGPVKERMCRKKQNMPQQWFFNQLLIILVCVGLSSHVLGCCQDVWGPARWWETLTRLTPLLSAIVLSNFIFYSRFSRHVQYVHKNVGFRFFLLNVSSHCWWPYILSKNICGTFFLASQIVPFRG